MSETLHDRLRAGAGLQLEEGRLDAIWYGPSPQDAPSLVFLHEGLGCIGMWKDFPRLLAERTGCGSLVYTRFGYGGSDPVVLPRPVNYMHTEALEVLPAVLEACEISRAILIGHSDGGSIALIHCGSDACGRVAGAVTMGAHVFVEDLSISSIEQTRERYESGELKARLEKYHGAVVDAVFRGWADIWLNPDFRHWNIEPCLRKLHQPLLVMQGEDDPYGTPAQVRAICEGSAGSATPVMLPDCSHWPHLEASEASLDAIGRFIQQLG